MLLIELTDDKLADRTTSMRQILKLFQSEWAKIEGESLFTLESDVDTIINVDPYLPYGKSTLFLTLTGMYLSTGGEYLSILNKYPLLEIEASQANMESPLIKSMISKIPIEQKHFCTYIIEDAMNIDKAGARAPYFSIGFTAIVDSIYPFTTAFHSEFTSKQEQRGRAPVRDTSYLFSPEMFLTLPLSPNLIV